MRTMMLAAMAAFALPCAARADGTAPLPPGQVRLVAGHDYILSAVGDGAGDPVTLIGPGGQVVAATHVDYDATPGTEFRARYSATYLIHTISPADAGTVAPDCRSGPGTLCHIAVNHTKRGAFQASFDSDWYKARLLAGRTYRVTYTPGLTAIVRVRDGRGRVLAQVSADDGLPVTLSYRPERAGDYFLEFAFDDTENGDASPVYTVSLR